jgi:GNAT superfamily N-acetyltransferase
MINLLSDCEPAALSAARLITDFDCGDSDLNEFFNCDAIRYQQQMLGQTYFFVRKSTREIVCAFSLSADSIKTCLLPNSRRRKVRNVLPHEKSLQSYPALLIGRLGVSQQYSGHGLGSQLLSYIMYFCITQYPHLARFIVVDAYNNPLVLNFYQRNDFLFLFSTEQQEQENLHKLINKVEPLSTRQMFYDLMRWQE